MADRAKAIPAVLELVLAKAHLDLVRIENDPEIKADRRRQVERLTPDAFGARASHLELPRRG